MFTHLLRNFSPTAANALQGHAGVIAALIVAASACAVVLATDPTNSASVAAGASESPDTVTGPAAAPAARLDHSVVESGNAADDQDWTRALIGVYGP